jgi:hypothetical protein
MEIENDVGCCERWMNAESGKSEETFSGSKICN